ncbi:MAG: fatty acid desaturase [Bacteroidota bacterium]
METETKIKKALKDWPNIIKPYKQANTWKAAVQILNSFGPFVGLWILMYFSLEWSYWITLALAVVNAFFLVRIFIIQHDCGHQSFFGNRKWNNVVGWVCSFFSSIPYSYWARVHSYHHGHTGQLEHRDIGDINFLTVAEYRKLSKAQRLYYRGFRHPIMLFFIVPVIYLVVSNRYPSIGFKGWKRTHYKQIINNLLLLGVFVALGFWLGWAKLLMVHLPIVYFFGVIAFWFFYIQHQHESTYMQWTKNWDFLLAAIKGATFYKLPRVFNWLTGNIGYHHIHHLSSRIPNYNLVRCARENPILQRYVKELRFGESLKTMFNKLWDEQQQRMITFREFYRMERNGAWA